MASSLRQIFSKVNVYRTVFHGREGDVLCAEQLEAKKKLFGDKWNVYMHETRRQWHYHGRGRNGSSAHHQLTPEKKKIVAGVSFNEAAALLRAHDENPKQYQLTNSSGQTCKDIGVRLEQYPPHAGQMHWRQVSIAQP